MKKADLRLHENKELAELMETSALPTSTVVQITLNAEGWVASAEVNYPPIYKKDEAVKYPAVVFM